MGKRRTPIENAIPTTARTTTTTTTATANNVNDDLDVNNNNETAIPLQPAMSKSELVWKNAQTALSQNLIPIIAAKPQDLIASFHNRTNNNDDHDDATGNSTNANSTTRRQLMETAQQLFRYIEHLASIEEKLKRVQKERRRRIKNNQMGEEEKHRHDHDDDHDDRDDDGEPCILSGLPSLYIGQESTANQIEQRLDLELELDAETIWGQVDLQNNALLPKLKKLIKKLAKKADEEEDVNNNDNVINDGEEDLIRILDMDGMASDEGDDEEEEEEDDGEEFDKLREEYEEVNDGNIDDEEKDEEESDADNDDDDNDEARRIRQRMEKAMADMDDDSDDNNDNEDDEEEEGAVLSATKQKQLQKLQSQAMEHELNMNNNNDDDGIIDPTREDMRDGFFDLHEMEAFADEEEEYLPEVAYGMVNEEVEDNEDSGDDSDEDEGGGKKKKKKKNDKKNKKKKMLPHVRQRMGQDSDSDDNDDGFDDDDDNDEDGLNDDDDNSFSKALTKRYQPSTIRRKKYRADDEVEALYQLYGGENNNNEEDNDNDNDGDFDFDEDDENNGENMGGDAGVEMTAADFFGKPDESIIKRYKKNSSHEEENSGGGGGAMKKKKKMGGGKAVQLLGHDYNDEDEDDADSWDDHNFAEDGMDWKEGKARKRNDDEEEEDYDEDGNQEDDNSEEEEEGEEEEEEMKGNNDDDGDDNDGPKSKHALQSKKLQEQTLRIEQEMMAEKPWKMKGESKGTDRPSDSLLDSTPEFEVAFKPPPIITAEHTTNIEDMIKQRINDEDWDDIIPRELPDIGANKRGGGEAPEVSQEKSKLGLGELYEREYLKKTTGFDRDQHEKQTDEDAAKEEMKKLFANLCSQLDALSNYHFAPRPVAEEAEVENREDVPAIAMEEVLPLHVSGGRGVAPEEVYGAGKGRGSVLKGESEMDQAERNRVRNAKKAARRKGRKQTLADEKLISKLQPGLGLNNPYEKRKLREELQMARASGKVVVAKDDKAYEDEGAAGKEYKTSAKFFQKMQENVESMVQGGGGEDGEGRGRKRRKGMEGGKGSSSYRL